MFVLLLPHSLSSVDRFLKLKDYLPNTNIFQSDSKDIQPLKDHFISQTLELHYTISVGSCSGHFS